jgi:hypothetical protein
MVWQAVSAFRYGTTQLIPAVNGREIILSSKYTSDLSMLCKLRTQMSRASRFDATNTVIQNRATGDKIRSSEMLAFAGTS